MGNRVKKTPETEKRITLRALSEYLKLSQTTVSVVVNDAPAARAIPQETRERILAAVRKFNYRPNYFARSLRKQRSMSVGVLVSEMSEGYFTLVMNGVEEGLLAAKYFYFIMSHYWKPELIEEYPRLLEERAADGLLLLNTPLPHQMHMPIVGISCHQTRADATNIVLDHEKAAVLGLKHLADLGHRRIAFMKGQSHTMDTEPRWKSIMAAASDLGVPVAPELCFTLQTNVWSPELGYGPVRELVQRTRDFTALFCFNDLAAIGAIRALHDEGLRVPQDVSVIGFDDVMGAAYGIPSLTTIRQPLRKMGMLGAELLLQRIAQPDAQYQSEVVMEPELVVRESTAVLR